MEKIYRVQMNSKGMPNFATAVEIADRPQGEWIDSNGMRATWNFSAFCSVCGEWSEYLTAYCGNCGARMKGADDE